MILKIFILILDIKLNSLTLSQSQLAGGLEGGFYYFNKKRRLRTLSSDFESRKFEISRKIRQRKRPSEVYYPNITLSVVFCISILAWASCVAYPWKWAMREPEVGISESTDSHVFFVYCRIRGKSIGINLHDYA